MTVVTEASSRADEAWLLLLPPRSEIYPMSPIALQQVQARRAALAEYRGALVVDRELGVRRVCEVRVRGAWGKTRVQRLLSRLLSMWAISVDLVPVAMPLGQLRALVLRCLRAQPDLEADLGWAPREAEVERAETLAELLDALALPGPEDALDVL